MRLKHKRDLKNGGTFDFEKWQEFWSNDNRQINDFYHKNVYRQSIV